MKIGDAIIMLADEHPEIGARGPKAYGGSPVSRRRPRRLMTPPPPGHT